MAANDRQEQLTPEQRQRNLRKYQEKLLVNIQREDIKPEDLTHESIDAGNMNPQQQKEAFLNKALFQIIKIAFTLGARLIKNSEILGQKNEDGRPALHAALRSMDFTKPAVQPNGNNELKIDPNFFAELLDKTLALNPKAIYLTDEGNRNIFTEALRKQAQYTQIAPTQNDAMEQIWATLQDTQMNLRSIAEQIIAEQKALVIDTDLSATNAQFLDSIDFSLLTGVMFVAMRHNYPTIMEQLTHLDEKIIAKQTDNPANNQTAPKSIFDATETLGANDEVDPLSAGIEAGSLEATKVLFSYYIKNKTLNADLLTRLQPMLELCRQQDDKSIYRMVLLTLFTQCQDTSVNDLLIETAPLDVVRYLLPDLFKHNIEVDHNEFEQLPYALFNRIELLLSPNNTDTPPGEDLTQADKDQIQLILTTFAAYMGRKKSFDNLENDPEQQLSNKEEYNKHIQARLAVHQLVIDWQEDPSAQAQDLFKRAAIELRTTEAEQFFSVLAMEQGVNPVINQDNSINPYILDIVKGATCVESVEPLLQSIFKDSANPNSLINLTDDKGETVFHKAARNPNPAILRLMLKHLKTDDSPIKLDDTNLIELCQDTPNTTNPGQTTYSIADLAAIHGGFEHIKLLDEHHVRFLFHQNEKPFDTAYYAAGRDPEILKFILNNVDLKNAPMWKSNLEARIMHAADNSQVESVRLLMKLADKTLTAKIAKALAKKIAASQPQGADFVFLEGIFEQTFAAPGKLTQSDEHDQLKEQGRAALNALDDSLAKAFIPEAKVKTATHAVQNARVLAAQKATHELFDGLNKIDPAAADAQEQAAINIAVYYDKTKVFTRPGQKAAKVLCAVLLGLTIGMFVGVLIGAAATGNIGALFAAAGAAAAWSSGGAVAGLAIGGVVGAVVPSAIIGSRMFKPNRAVTKVNQQAAHYYTQALSAKA